MEVEDPASRLPRFVEASRNWAQASRGREVLAHAEEVLRSIFSVDQGLIVYAKQGELPGTRPESLQIYRSWGFDTPDASRKLSHWFERYRRTWPNRALMTNHWQSGAAVDFRVFPPQGKRPAMVGQWILSRQSTPIGALVLSRSALEPDDSDVFTLFAMQISLVLELLVQRRIAEEIGRLDVLTGLWNRRGILDHLPSMVAQAQRRHEELVLAVADVNRLKSINDRHGHLAGDRTLQDVGRHLTGMVRRGDLVGRWGGDEFILLIHARAGEGSTVAQRLTRELASTNLAQTVSIGCAVWGIDGVDWDSCFQVADQRCYQHKWDRQLLLPQAPVFGREPDIP